MNTKFFLFHFAGGSSFSYDYLRKIPGIDITALELPSRGKRIKEALLTDLNDAVQDYYNQIIKNTNGNDYVIYGHSMGALLGYLVCHKIQENNLPLPSKLIVSGRKAPSIVRDRNIAKLPDNKFLKEVYDLGGMPDEIKNYPELVNFFLPILKSDFALIESYVHEKRDKLKVPIDVFFGSSEAYDFEMDGWIEESSQLVNITKLEGNHFFIYDHQNYFKNYFIKLNEETHKILNVI